MVAQLTSNPPPQLAFAGESAGDGRAPARGEPPLRPRLRGGAVWVILSRSFGVGTTTAVNIALARWLSPEDFGSFLLLCSILALASLLAMFGLNAAVVRFVSESLGRGDVASARASMRLVLVVAAVPIAAVAGLAALALAYFDTAVFGLPNSREVVAMAVTSLILLAILQLVAEACRSVHELRLASLFSGGQTGGLLSNVIFLVLIAAAVVVAKPGFSTAVALNLTAMGVCLPIAVFGLRGAMRTRLTPAATTRLGSSGSTLSARQLLAFSVPMLLIQLLTFTTTQADLWIAGICWPHDQLALYGAARRLILLITLPLQMANLTVISSIADLYGQQRLRDLERVLRRASAMAALPSLGAIAVLILFGGPILTLLFGPFFAEAAVPLGILAAGQLVLVCAGSCGCALEMTGHEFISLTVNLLSALALIVVGTWSARQFGMVGLSVASTSIITAQSVSLWLLARKFVGVWTHPALVLVSATGSPSRP